MGYYGFEDSFNSLLEMPEAAAWGGTVLGVAASFNSLLEMRTQGELRRLPAEFLQFQFSIGDAGLSNSLCSVGTRKGSFNSLLEMRKEVLASRAQQPVSFNSLLEMRCCC